MNIRYPIYEGVYRILTVNAVWTVAVKVFSGFFLIIFHYNTGLTISIFNPSASMIRQNVLIPGSTIPFSILEI